MGWCIGICCSGDYVSHIMIDKLTLEVKFCSKISAFEQYGKWPDFRANVKSVHTGPQEALQLNPN